MSADALIWLPLAALLAGLLLQIFLARLLTARSRGWLAFASSLVALGGVLALWPPILQGQVLQWQWLPWDGPATLAYQVDGLSQLFALMATGIGATVLLYSVSYMAQEQATARFYILMLLFIGGMVHLVYSADLLLLYLSWEVIGLCSFLLVGFWYWQEEAAAGARKVLVMTHIAGYGLLAAVILLYLRSGSTLWSDPAVAGAFSTGLFLLVLVAAMAKSVQFPLHTWIPDAMAAPTPVSALLHAACYVKAGVYVIARLHSVAPWPVAWQTLVIWIGTVTLLVGGLYALIQSDLKRLLAFSTVSQIGYILLGLGLATPLGLAAGLLHCLNHGIFKGGLFLCAGAVQHATGTRDMDRLGGLARRMPRTAGLWLVLAASVAGVPLLGGFVSKWLLFNAALQAGQVLPALIAWIATIITIFYFLKASSGVFLGNESDAATRAHEAPRPMLAGAALLALLTVVIGVAPQLAVQYVIYPLLPAVNAAPVIGVSWLGLTVAGGDWFATGGLILAIIALGVAAIVYGLARPGQQVALSGSGIFSGGEPLAGPSRLPASDFSLIIRQNLAPFYAWANPDRYYEDLGRALRALSYAAARGSRWLEQRAVTATAALFLALAAGVWLGTRGVGGADVALVAPAVSWGLWSATTLAFTGLLLVSASRRETQRLLPLLAAAGALSLQGLLASGAMTRLLLLEAAAVTALVLVWIASPEKGSRRAYLLAVLLAAAATLSGHLIADTASPALVRALLLTGFALKLALVPLYLWLPLVAEAVPAVVAGLVIAVVDVAAFGELLALRTTLPWLFNPAGPWITLGLLSALGGATLMLAQHNVKRLLAFSTLEDMGYLLLGLTWGGALGLAGAALGLVVHALAKGLLFASLSAAEGRESLTLDRHGLARHYPVSATAFLVGVLAMLGLPPTLGFVARWRLYAVAGQSAWFFMALLFLAGAMAVLAYARIITRFWWGSAPDEQDVTPGGHGEPRSLQIVLLILGAVLLLSGIWPGFFNWLM